LVETAGSLLPVDAKQGEEYAQKGVTEGWRNEWKVKEYGKKRTENK
jgi:hypothetical protein